MSRPVAPVPPDTMPEQPEFSPGSRYRRPRRLVSWWGLFIGVMIGLIGGLFYAWNVAPIEEFDTLPRQLRPADKASYVVAIMLQFDHDSDLGRAINQIVSLDLGPDPIQEVANIACELARTGYVDSNAGLQGVRSLKTFYQLQGRSGCADTLIPDVNEPQVLEITVPTPTPTLPPPPTKTATIAPDQANPASATATGVFVVPTTPPRRDYAGRIAGTFCDAELSGLIEVFVQDFNGGDVPGERIRVRWEGDSSIFVSGLKPERGDSYADFRMEAGRGYTIDMPGLSDPIDTPLVASPCNLDNGGQAITSYRVVFRRVG